MTTPTQDEIVRRFESLIGEVRLMPCDLDEYAAAMRASIELLEAELGAVLVALEDMAATDDPPLP